MVAMVSARTNGFTFSDRSLLLLKLSAFVVMIFDHADLFRLTSWGIHSGVGRLVFPVFGVVLAYNLARIDPDKILRKVAPRILLIGVISHLLYVALSGRWVPLNIMFTLWLAATVYAYGVQGRWLFASLAALVVGYYVDYAWFGVFGICVVASQFRSGDKLTQAIAITSFAAMLTIPNHNTHALWAVPLILAAAFLPGSAPRCRWLFWIGYPVHLLFLLLIRVLS